MIEPEFPENMLIFGCGNMAGAMLRGWIGAGIAPHRFTVVKPTCANLPGGVCYAACTAQVTQRFDTAMLGIKPQMLPALAGDIRSLLAPGATVISILAGAGSATLSRAFPAAKIVRLMPNMAARIGQSPIGLWSDHMTAAQKSAFAAVTAPLGTPFWLPEEAQMDAFTALAGSGPAFVFRMIDALAAAGSGLGLDPDQASQIAITTARGAAMLAAQANVSTALLAAQVASPGGSTAAGLAVLDRNDALRELIAATLGASAAHNARLARVASGDDA
jgi:pyrroline-5-carboxylate reductase